LVRSFAVVDAVPSPAAFTSTCMCVCAGRLPDVLTFDQEGSPHRKVTGTDALRSKVISANGFATQMTIRRSLACTIRCTCRS
jgi:hypothetical protein